VPPCLFALPAQIKARRFLGPLSRSLDLVASLPRLNGSKVAADAAPE